MVLILLKKKQIQRLEIGSPEAEHGKYYYCIKDYFYGGKKFASKGDVIQALRGLPIMGLKDVSEYFLPVNSIKCNSAWSEEDSIRLQRIIDFLWYNRKGDTDTIYQQEQDIDWLKSLIDRIGCEANCTTTKEWSEEDRKRIQRISDFIWKNRKGDTDDIYQQEQDVEWLQSLKQRYTWKPSEKQIMCLQDALSDYRRRGYKAETLETLLEQLKQL